MYDKVQLQKKNLKNTLYFPDSLVNILSDTVFGKSLGMLKVHGWSPKVNTHYWHVILVSTPIQFLALEVFSQYFK